MDAKIVAAVLLIVLLLFTPMPLINSINPDHGLNIGTVDVVISGAKFDNKATIKLSKPGEPDIVATNVKVISKKQISCSFDLLGQTAGKWNVIVANKNEFTKKDKTASLAEAFTIQYPAPTISTIEPNRGLNSKIVTARLTGNWFRTGAKVILNKGNQNIAAISVTVNAPTQIDSQFNLENAEPGMYDVQVINDDEQMGILEKGFLIGTPAPEVTAIKPNQGIIAEKITALVTGNNFRTGAKVALDNGQQVIKASEIKVLSATEISSKLDLTGFSPGIYNVTVTNDDGQSGSLAGGFVVNILKPAINAINPAEGFNNGALLTEITGDNFAPGALVKLVGPTAVEIPGLNIDIKNSGQITCFFDLTQKPVGSYDVMVINPNGQSAVLPNGFKVKVYIPNNQELNDLLKPVFFDFDRFALRTDQIPILDADVKILTQHSKLYILLGGHADERGTREYNLELSKKRAEAIRDFLVAKGIDSTNIVIYAYGKDYPVKKGHDESSWWYNRRVDIIVWESPPTREQGLIKIIGTDGENN